jgi:hypothetical protein
MKRDVPLNRYFIVDVSNPDVGALINMMLLRSIYFTYLPNDKLVVRMNNISVLVDYWYKITAILFLQPSEITESTAKQYHI